MGATVWLTGLPSSGKSTIAVELAKRAALQSVAVEVFDGDQIRAVLFPELGYSRKDRDANVRRIGYLARLANRLGALAIVPVIAPFAAARDDVRCGHDKEGLRYLEVFVDTPLAMCEVRDVKGLYARARRGELQGLTGLDDPYEAPINPDVHIHTDTMELAVSVEAICAELGPSLREGTSHRDSVSTTRRG